MSDANAGKILVAIHNGVYVIKMSGDVRLTLCIPFDEHIERLISQDGFESVLFDLSKAEGLDSTTLGLMAKLAVKNLELKGHKSLIVSDDPGIQRLLICMGLDEICEIISAADKEQIPSSEFTDLESKGDYDENAVREKVLESHIHLMGLNDKNKETFKDLVCTLRSA
jgi:anti-anti-sigma factor